MFWLHTTYLPWSDPALKLKSSSFLFSSKAQQVSSFLPSHHRVAVFCCAVFSFTDLCKFQYVIRKQKIQKIGYVIPLTIPYQPTIITSIPWILDIWFYGPKYLISSPYIHHGFWGEFERGRDSYQPSLFPTFPNLLRFQGAAQRPPPAEPGPIRFYPTMTLGHKESLKLIGICSIRTQKLMEVWPSNMDITCIWYVHICIYVSTIIILIPYYNTWYHSSSGHLSITIIILFHLGL